MSAYSGCFDKQSWSVEYDKFVISACLIKYIVIFAAYFWDNVLALIRSNALMVLSKRLLSNPKFGWMFFSLFSTNAPKSLFFIYSLIWRTSTNIRSQGFWNAASHFSERNRSILSSSYKPKFVTLGCSVKRKYKY